MTGVVAEPDAGSSVRLRLQRLPGPVQVLSVAKLVELRHPERVFTTAEVGELFTDLRLPRQVNLSSPLGRFVSQGLLVRPRSDVWAFTPEGDEYLRSRASGIDTDKLRNELVDVPNATLGQRNSTIIPPFLAPQGSAPGVDSLLRHSSFETNVFLITRYPKTAADKFTRLISELRTACQQHGLNLLVATDGNAQDTIWDNVVTYMWASKYGIVLVDADDAGLNANVLIEVGAMLMTGRRCAIIRDASVPSMPTDLVGHIYRQADFNRPDAVVDAAHIFMNDDLRLPRLVG